MPHRSGGIQPDQVDHGQPELELGVIGPTLSSLCSRFEELVVIAKIEVQDREGVRRQRAARIQFHRFLDQRYGVREAVEGISIQNREGHVQTGPRRIERDGPPIDSFCFVKAALTLQREAEILFDLAR